MQATVISDAQAVAASVGGFGRDFHAGLRLSQVDFHQASISTFQGSVKGPDVCDFAGRDGRAIYSFFC
ncbi:hypothetical protein [Glaciimonas sp. PCH181]|uniref:hypothetical protein n=1 Tax=Glaciimonas sp. PCH181 TaxID=2133943 RepID=UPI000D384C49|nr:hypothetical protein [Glaciimonas sp. PCH181]PUA19713.1 hypothetical protein C7W93_07740 [Glaciimonas sp. PCH181]